MKRIIISRTVGSFAEDKNAAGKLRNEVILPGLADGKKILLDFAGITLTTQSFIHALIAEGLRRHGEKALDLFVFKNCGPVVKGIIETVVQYVLETTDPK